MKDTESIIRAFYILSVNIWKGSVILEKFKYAEEIDVGNDGEIDVNKC